MKKFCKLWLLGVWIVVLSFTPVNGSSLTGQLDFISSFIFRGTDLNPDKKPVLQPQVTYFLGKSGLSVNLFSSISFEDKKLTELDLTLAYDHAISESLAVSVGVIHYGWYLHDDFTFKKDTTTEFFAGVTLPRIPLSPKLTLYYDINLGDGLYAELALLQSLKVGKNTQLDLSATLGYNAGQWLPEDADTGFSDLTFGATLPLKTGKISIVPYVNYTFVLLDALGDKNFFWAGLSIIL